ncbi:hypothetical protein HZF02_16060 [Pseudomonas yamanorum]|nr:hypothetical protein HZF02_16060 [Pseudomonas yamanorum]
MSVTPEKQKVIPQTLEDLLRCIDRQVRRDIDQMRAKHYWGKTLEETPREVLAEALSMALATGRYQITQHNRCHCCNHRH